MLHNNIGKHTSQPPLVRVSGSHRQIGQQIGEAIAPLVRHSIQNAHEVIDTTYESLQLTWDGAKIQASKYIPFAQERYIEYIAELKGIAEGADVAFDDLAVLIAMEAVTMDALHLTKCTSFAVNSERTANGHVLIAHN
jgi:isopenicillin-N N-acyltransferase-like protein